MNSLPWGTVYHYFHTWRDSGVWGQLQRSLYESVRIAACRDVCPSVVIMGSQSVELANLSDQRGGSRLLAGLSPLFPRVQVVFADAGHESSKLAREHDDEGGWKLQITKRGCREFVVTGLTWIVERTFAWLGRNRRFSKDYEYRVQTSETMLEIAGIRLMLNRMAPP